VQGVSLLELAGKVLLLVHDMSQVKLFQFDPSTLSVLFPRFSSVE
jgi:hypothetical protein